MKSLLIKAIVCCAALLPLTVNAKDYGGWSPGKTFTLKVTERESLKASLSGNAKKVAVPAGIPDYKKGASVKFKIGSKGELTGPDGLNIPFKQDATTANVYATLPTKSNPRANVAQVYKNGKQPQGASLTFFKVTGSGFSATVTTVVYILE